MQEHYCQDEEEKSCTGDGDAPPIDIVVFDISSSAVLASTAAPLDQPHQSSQNDINVVQNDDQQYDVSRGHRDQRDRREKKEDVAGRDESRQTNDTRRGLRIIFLITAILGETLHCNTTPMMLFM